MEWKDTEVAGMELPVYRQPGPEPKAMNHSCLDSDAGAPHREECGRPQTLTVLVDRATKCFATAAGYET